MIQTRLMSRLVQGHLIQGPARSALAARAGLFRSAVLAALILAPVAALPSASAQVFGQAPYAPAPDPAMDRLETRLDMLEAELRRVTGRNEQLSFDLAAARRLAEEAQREVAALQARLSALEAGGAPGVGAGPGDTLAAPSTGGPISLGSAASANAASNEALASRIDPASLPQDEGELLKEARNLLLEGDYPSAQRAFSHYLATHTQGPSAAEAQYLLGESLLYQGSYPEAAEAYGKLLSDHPDSSRGPEGLVKLARSMRLMDKKREACQALGLMSTRFPNASNAAKTLASTERSRAGC